MTRYETVWMTWHMEWSCYVKFIVRKDAPKVRITDEQHEPVKNFLKAVEVMGSQGYWYAGEIEVDPGENQIYMFQGEYRD